MNGPGGAVLALQSGNAARNCKSALQLIENISNMHLEHEAILSKCSLLTVEEETIKSVVILYFEVQILQGNAET